MLLPQYGAGECTPEGDSGCISPGEALLPVEALLDSTPDNLFADASGSSTRQPASGSTTVYPTRDTLIYFTEFISGRLAAASNFQVHVLSDDVSLTFPQRHMWGCHNAFGSGAGWSAAIYERGQIASPDVAIVAVRNIGTFAVRILLQRDDRFDEVVVPVGAATSELNGSYFGIWQVGPADDVVLPDPHCTSSGTVNDPALPGVVTPLPDIVLDISLNCTVDRP